MYKKYTKFQRAVLWVVFVFFMIYAISLLYPFFWALINSLKSQAEFSENSFSLPAEVLFSNFSKAFQELKVGNVNFINIFTNSILYTALSTALAVLSSSVAAYVVSKYDFKLKNFFYALAIFFDDNSRGGGAAFPIQIG